MFKGVRSNRRFSRMRMDQIAGTFHFSKNKLEIREASARHSGTTLTLGHGSVDLHPGGGHYADLTDLRPQALVIDEDFLNALPKQLAPRAAPTQTERTLWMWKRAWSWPRLPNRAARRIFGGTGNAG